MDSTDRDDLHDLGALDFSPEVADQRDDRDQSGALDFSVSDDGTDGIEALDEFAPAEPSDEPGMEALDEDTDEADVDDPLAAYTFTVTNPPETVSVAALVDGRITQVELSAGAAKMTEAELTNEIAVIAELARQKALAGQRAYLSDNPLLSDMVHEMGPIAGTALRDFMDGMGLVTPEQASATQAEVFATRYPRGDG